MTRCRAVIAFLSDFFVFALQCFQSIASRADALRRRATSANIRASAPLLSLEAADGDLGLRQLPCPLSRVELDAARLAGVVIVWASSSWLLEMLAGRLGGRRPPPPPPGTTWCPPPPPLGVASSGFVLCVVLDVAVVALSLGVGERRSSTDLVRDCNETTRRLKA